MAGGNLPFGLAPSGSMTSYTPTLREKATDWMRRTLFSDDRAGQGRAEKVMEVASMTPFGFGLDVYDAGREAGQGNLGAAAVNMAVVPFAVAAKTPVKRAALEANQTLMGAIRGTKGARIADEGVALNVTRNQQPDQALEESVRGGVFYLPEGDKNAKFYTGTGFNLSYGGPQKIEGETLFKNPLVAKGATGGKAPEAAFDTVMGKGAYQAMRKDALASLPPYYLKEPELRRELVQRFLSKHAPEMLDRADHILANSTRGNQLAYALQEAAVASAVRKAGHDGVLGYSVRRKTGEPFISEVFDVRENYYPSPDGKFSMWPQFYPPEAK